MLEVYRNTDLIEQYHRLTTTIIVSGEITAADKKLLIDTMNDYLHHGNCIVIHDTTIEKVVKQAMKAKQKWFKNVYCYKYEIVNNDIVIYIGCNEQFLRLEDSKGW